MPLNSFAIVAALEVNEAQRTEFVSQRAPFQIVFGGHEVGRHEAPFQYSFGVHELAAATDCFVDSHLPFFPADSPAGHFVAQGPSVQMRFRKSDSSGLCSPSLHGSFRQILLRRSVSGALGSCSFAGGFSPMRGAGMILPSSPEIFCVGTMRRLSGSGACTGLAVFPAFQFGDDEPKSWLGDGLETGAEWLTGLLAGLGLLGILAALGVLCDIDEALDAELDELLGGGLGGAGGGLLGVLLVEECCAKVIAGNNRTTATRLESLIKHLTKRMSAGRTALLQWTLPSLKGHSKLSEIL
jgi:hypothetical protein